MRLRAARQAALTVLGAVRLLGSGRLECCRMVRSGIRVARRSLDRVEIGFGVAMRFGVTFFVVLLRVRGVLAL